MSSKPDPIIEKLKNFDKGKLLAELMETMEKVDTKSVNAKLNKESFVDSEGKRIFYLLTEDDIKRQVTLGRNGLNFGEGKECKSGVLKRFLKALYMASLLLGVCVGYLVWASNKPVILWLVVYYLAVEVVRRAFLYIFFNKHFLSLADINKKIKN